MDDKSNPTGDAQIERIVDHVVEQRVSNLAQGLLFLVTMTGPLLIVLHLIPQAVLAGLFFVMGTQALAGNGITLKILYLFRDRELTEKSAEPLARLDRQKTIWIFVAIELIGFGATFAITQTIAAIGFPVIILLLIPVRTFIMPKYFHDEELRALDAPTAGAFVMESVGGAYGHGHDDEDEDESAMATPANGLRSPDDNNDDAIIEDSDLAERGESYELRSGSVMKGHRSHSEMQMPQQGVGRRSVSSRGRGRPDEL